MVAVFQVGFMRRMLPRIKICIALNSETLWRLGQSGIENKRSRKKRIGRMTWNHFKKANEILEEKKKQTNLSLCKIFVAWAGIWRYVARILEGFPLRNVGLEWKSVQSAIVPWSDDYVVLVVFIFVVCLVATGWTIRLLPVSTERHHYSCIYKSMSCFHIYIHLADLFWYFASHQTIIQKKKKFSAQLSVCWGTRNGIIFYNPREKALQAICNLCFLFE